MSGDIARIMEEPSSSRRRESFRRGFLECGICFSTFCEPKFLPCVHTFCKECLSSYIQNVCSRHQPFFACPTCRERIPIPNPVPPTTEWANQFKNNFLINNLIGIVSNEETTPTQIQSTLQGKTCFQHPGKPLEFVCVDCNLMICAHCSVVLHKTCLQIITLEEAVREKRENIRNYRHIFYSHLNRASTKKAEQEKDRIELQRHYSLQKQRILEHVSKAIEYVKQQGTNCIEDLQLAYQEYESELDQELTEHNSRENFMKKMCDVSDKLMSGTDFTSVFEHFHTLQGYSDKLSSYKEMTSCDIQVREIHFDPKPMPPIQIGIVSKVAKTREIKLPQITAPPASPGILAAPRSPVSPVEAAQLGDSSPYHSLANGTGTLVLQRTFSAKVKGDKNAPSLQDAVYVSGSVLVVTDRDNTCVKSFYSHGQKDMQSKLVMEKKPHGICNYVGTMIAVTVPRAKHIAILSVTPTLILQNTIKTEMKYWGITAVGTDAFAVSSCPGTGAVTIHFIDMQGTVLRCIHNDTSLFSNPLYMCTLSNGDIMVSDCTVPKVACLRGNGNVLFSCTGGRGYTPKKPMSMDDCKGLILLADGQPSLALLDYSGQVVYTLSKTAGLKEPKGVAFGSKGTVFVANDNGMIGVFKVSVKDTDQTSRKTFF